MIIIYKLRACFREWLSISKKEFLLLCIKTYKFVFELE